MNDTNNTRTATEEMSVLRGALAHKVDAEKRLANLKARVESLSTAIATIEEVLRNGPTAAQNVELLIIARQAISDEQMGWTK